MGEWESPIRERHAASLRPLRLGFDITSQPESHRELAALEGGFLESVLLDAPLPALRCLDFDVQVAAADKARCLDALRPLARVSLPRLSRLSLNAYRSMDQALRTTALSDQSILAQRSLRLAGLPWRRWSCAWTIPVTRRL